LVSRLCPVQHARRKVRRRTLLGAGCSIEHQTTNLGAGGSNPSGRANEINGLLGWCLPPDLVRADQGQKKGVSRGRPRRKAAERSRTMPPLDRGGKRGSSILSAVVPVAGGVAVDPCASLPAEIRVNGGLWGSVFPRDRPTSPSVADRATQLRPPSSGPGATSASAIAGRAPMIATAWPNSRRDGKARVRGDRLCKSFREGLALVVVGHLQVFLRRRHAMRLDIGSAATSKILCPDQNAAGMVPRRDSTAGEARRPAVGRRGEGAQRRRPLAPHPTPPHQARRDMPCQQAAGMSGASITRFIAGRCRGRAAKGVGQRD
jgi:hypothetical protein